MKERTYHAPINATANSNAWLCAQVSLACRLRCASIRCFQDHARPALVLTVAFCGAVASPAPQGPRCPVRSIPSRHCNSLLTFVLCVRSRGIGMTIESDFYATDAGRKHFSDQLTSIRCTLLHSTIDPMHCRNTHSLARGDQIASRRRATLTASSPTSPGAR